MRQEERVRRVSGLLRTVGSVGAHIHPTGFRWESGATVPPSGRCSFARVSGVTAWKRLPARAFLLLQMDMTDKERFHAIIAFEKPDRMPYREQGFRGGTMERWYDEGMKRRRGVQGTRIRGHRTGFGHVHRARRQEVL